MAGKSIVDHVVVATAGILTVTTARPTVAQAMPLAKVSSWHLGPNSAGKIPACRSRVDAPPPIVMMPSPTGLAGRDRGQMAQRLEIGDGSYGVSLDVRRYKFRSWAEQPSRDGVPRGGVWSIELRPAMTITPGDNLGLLGGVQWRRFHFPSLIDNGHHDGSMQQMIGIFWSHAEGLDVSAGWQRTTSLSRHDPLERGLAVAAGSPIAGNGPRIAFTLSPFGGRAHSAVRLGLTATDNRLDPPDLLALGAHDGHDRRLLLSLATAF